MTKNDTKKMIRCVSCGESAQIDTMRAHKCKRCFKAKSPVKYPEYSCKACIELTRTHTCGLRELQGMFPFGI